MKALRSCPLFAGMSEIEIDLTLGNISYQLVSLPSHEVYALAGMPCKYVDIVVVVSLSVVWQLYRANR